MTKSPPSKRRVGPLVGLALALFLFVLLLALFGDDSGSLACVPVAPASAATRSSEPVDPPLSAQIAIERPLPPSISAESESKPASMQFESVSAGNVSGTVIDRETREHVPFIVVKLEGEGTHDEVTTDPQGAFASNALFRAGRVRAIVIDDGVVVEHLEASIEGPVGLVGWLLDVPIGPTYPIPAIDGRPIDAAAWTAQLYESTLDERDAGEIKVTPAGFELESPNTKFPDREWSRVRVRESRIPFARWPTREHASDKRYRAKLVLRSETLFARADEPVRSTVGEHFPLSPRSKPRAVVTGGFARQSSLNKLASPLRVVLFDAKHDSSKRLPDFREVLGTAEGYRFDDVPPGSWSIVAWSPNSVSSIARVQVSRGDSYSPKPLSLEVSEDGQKEVDFWRERRDELVDSAEVSQVVVLAPSRAFHATRGLALRADAISAEVFAFEGAGMWDEFDLRVIGIGGGSAYPRTIRTAAKLVGRVDRSDTEPSRRERYAVAGFRSFADTPGGVRVAYGPAGSTFTVRELGGDGSIAASPSAGLRWSAWAIGCAPVFGTEKDFATRADANGRSVRVAEARLKSGWGAQISLRAGDPLEIEKQPWPWNTSGSLGDRRLLGALAAPPLPNVGVFVDGASTGGTSDENGDIQLSLSTMPVRLTLRASGWRLCGLEALEGPGVRYIAWLKRTP